VAREGPGGLLTVGKFRDATGINRNAVMPMLEFFDRTGFTTRRPDGRALRLDRMTMFEDQSLLWALDGASISTPAYNRKA